MTPSLSFTNCNHYRYHPINLHHRRNTQRIQCQRCRIIRRRRITINNATNTLSQITQLPRQITNNEFANQLFNDINFHY